MSWIRVVWAKEQDAGAVEESSVTPHCGKLPISKMTFKDNLVKTSEWKQAKTSHTQLWDLYMKMKCRSEMLLLHQEKLFFLCDRTSVMSFCNASQCTQLVRYYSNSGWGRGLNWGGWQMGSELQIYYSARNPLPKGGLFFDCVDPPCHLVFPLHPGEDKSDRIMWSYGLELWKAPVPDSFTLVWAEDWAVCSLSKLCS